MSHLEIILIVNSLFSLSCHAYLFPLFGTGQHRYPVTFSFLIKLQALLILGAAILIFGWIWGIILGIILALWSVAIFTPVQIGLHLLHGINLAKQEIPVTKFPWDTLTNFINFLWMLSLLSLLILMIMNLLK